MSSDGVAYLLSKHLATARVQCPSLRQKRVTPHVLRHNTETPITLRHGRSIEIPRQLQSEARNRIRIIGQQSKWLVARVHDV